MNKVTCCNADERGVNDRHKEQTENYFYYSRHCLFNYNTCLLGALSWPHSVRARAHLPQKDGLRDIEQASDRRDDDRGLRVLRHVAEQRRQAQQHHHDNQACTRAQRVQQGRKTVVDVQKCLEKHTRALLRAMHTLHLDLNLQGEMAMLSIGP